LRAGGEATGFDGGAQLLVQLAREVLAAVDDNVKFHTSGAPAASWDMSWRLWVAPDYAHLALM
jgi:hypothetical protein